MSISRLAVISLVYNLVITLINYTSENYGLALLTFCAAGLSLTCIND